MTLGPSNMRISNRLLALFVTAVLVITVVIYSSKNQRNEVYVDPGIHEGIKHHLTTIEEGDHHRNSDTSNGITQTDVLVKTLELPSSHSTPPNESTHILTSSSDPIAVLVIACNRVTVDKAINSILKYRPSDKDFPLIVSQDCNDDKTAKVIDSYQDKLTHIMQPDQSPVKLEGKERKMIGYYKIARHYKWALTQIFDIYSYKAAIIIEDDLELAPDFFSYMKATYSLLLTDPSLMCVSAWNDNGKEPLIDVNRNDLLYRTDFFPGLGWMLTADFWRELKPKWPASYWDDWLRKSEQRNGRSCIRPEISRSQTFGKVGISNGQYFNKHLKFIFANKKPYDFEKADLSYLLKENYDKKFTNKISKLPAVSFNDVNSNRVNQESIVKYSNEKEFVQFAKKIGLMSDTRDGIPRTAYHGIVSFYKNGHRIHLVHK